MSTDGRLGMLRVRDLRAYGHPSERSERSGRESGLLHEPSGLGAIDLEREVPTGRA
jgi:hypothetical protein